MRYMKYIIICSVMVAFTIAIITPSATQSNAYEPSKYRIQTDLGDLYFTNDYIFNQLGCVKFKENFKQKVFCGTFSIIEQ